MTGGLGSFLGSLLGGEVVGLFPGRYDLVFLVPCLINLALICLLFLKFRPSAATPGVALTAPAPLSNLTRTGRAALASPSEN